MSFLVAEWRKLAIANYEMQPEVLKPFVPKGTELDLWKEKCYISLVGFMFMNTKLLGVKVPFHVNFEEVNLRFYVRRSADKSWKRGVVFIKEIVPKKALTFVANTVYNENYETMPMGHKWIQDTSHRTVEYQWKKDGNWQRLYVKAALDAKHIEPGSVTEFITEHYWGYAKVNEQLTNEYEVTHPKWLNYEVLDFEVSVDFEKVYGPSFAFLNDQQPVSVMLAEGSEITVENKQRIK